MNPSLRAALYPVHNTLYLLWDLMMHTKVKHLAHIITAVCKLYPVSVHCKHCGTSVGVRRDLMMHTRVKHLAHIITAVILIVFVHCKHCGTSVRARWDLEMHTRVKHCTTSLHCKHCGTSVRGSVGSGDAQKRRTSGSYLMLMHPRPVAYRNLHNAQTMHNL